MDVEVWSNWTSRSQKNAGYCIFVPTESKLCVTVMRNGFFPSLNTANMQEGKSRSTLYDYRLPPGLRQDVHPQNYIFSPPKAHVIPNNSSLKKKSLKALFCQCNAVDCGCDSEGIPFAVRKLENLHNGCGGWWLSAKQEAQFDFDIPLISDKVLQKHNTVDYNCVYT